MNLRKALRTASVFALLAGFGAFTPAAPIAPQPVPVTKTTDDAAEQIKGLIIDSFAGGGGASLGIEWALGRSPDFAINHDPQALAMHAANHPETIHLTEDVWNVNPKELTLGNTVALLWCSPDCRHHSRAAGNIPRSKSVRSLADVILYWANTVRPNVICLENVREFAEWGPLGEDGKPCRWRKGWDYYRFIRTLEAEGYEVSARSIKCCNYGPPTIRTRLFIIARRDNKPIIWPEETHGDPLDPRVQNDELSPYGTAAHDIIDWTIPSQSIFMDKREARARRLKIIRPLKPKTMKRIALGFKRHVLDRPQPFMVTINHSGGEFRGQAINEAFRTVTAARDAHGLVTPFIASVSHGEKGPNSQRWGKGSRPIDAPLATVTRSNDHATIAPFLAYAQQGGRTRPSQAPIHTITASRKDQNQVVAAHLMTMRNSDKPTNDIDRPAHTVTAGGAGSTLVSGMFVPRYGEREGQAPRARAIDALAPTAVPTGNGGDLATVHLAQLNDNTTDGTSLPLEQNPLARGPVAAWLAQHNGGPRAPIGRAADTPSSTIATAGSQQQLVQALFAQRNSIPNSLPEPTEPLAGAQPCGRFSFMAPFQSQSFGASVEEPLGTVLSRGNHHAVIELPFIQAYYGQGTQGQNVDAPLWTVPTKGRFGPTEAIAVAPPFTEDMKERARMVATFLRAHGVWDDREFVTIGDYIVVDITMRMLSARELARAQGFPEYYDISATGTLTDTAMRQKIGNSVCPHAAFHIVRANLIDAMKLPDVKNKVRAKVIIGPGLPGHGRSCP